MDLIDGDSPGFHPIRVSWRPILRSTTSIRRPSAGGVPDVQIPSVCGIHPCGFGCDQTVPVGSACWFGTRRVTESQRIRVTRVRIRLPSTVLMVSASWVYGLGAYTVQPLRHRLLPSRCGLDEGQYLDLWLDRNSDERSYNYGAS